jgi:hypothetical protein
VIRVRSVSENRAQDRRSAWVLHTSIPVVRRAADTRLPRLEELAPGWLWLPAEIDRPEISTGEWPRQSTGWISWDGGRGRGELFGGHDQDRSSQAGRR